MPPVEIDGNPITGATIDGTDVQEITVDGDVVFTSGPQPPSPGNLVIHVDASQESLSNNATTTTVTDFSGNGNDFTSQFNGAVTYKSNAIGGLPAFEVNDHRFRSASNVTLTSPISAAAVYEQNPGNGQAQILNMGGNRFEIRRDTGEFETDAMMRMDVSSQIGFKANMGDGSGSPESFIGVISSSTYQGELNGTSVSSLDSFVVQTINEPVDLFMDATRNTRGLKGLLSEVLLYDTAVNFTDLSDYIQNKYGTF